MSPVRLLPLFPVHTSPPSRGREERGHAIEMNSVSSNESTVRNLRKPRKLSRIGVQSSHRKDLFEFSALICLKVFAACAKCSGGRLSVKRCCGLMNRLMFY